MQARKNPQLYFPGYLDSNVGTAGDVDDQGLDTKLQKMCLDALAELGEVNAVVMDEEMNVKCTQTGTLTSMTRPLRFLLF